MIENQLEGRFNPLLDDVLRDIQVLKTTKYLYFQESAIVRDNTDVSFLIKQIPGLNFQTDTVLLYRGTRDGWLHSDFHNLCDERGPTLTILKTKKGRICGGYTKLGWTNPQSGEYKFDNQAFIFSLDLKARFPAANSAKSVYHRQASGPSFGGGALELRFEPMNNKMREGV
ncbi:hypothetical protein FGO68_gene12183 [Halteria grandinella]|uniref:TLDc domain-containing protein n=1 Tax=Halteria grandinella TaxID=5974 RepID=A0A8J8N969_HALGN|nr:hypothetical protein FGO68_gene12183 [Halteria grandinella]